MKIATLSLLLLFLCQIHAQQVDFYGSIGNVPQLETLSTFEPEKCDIPIAINQKALAGQEIVIGFVGEVTGDGKVILGNLEGDNISTSSTTLDYESPIFKIKDFETKKGRQLALFGLKLHVDHVSKESNIVIASVPYEGTSGTYSSTADQNPGYLYLPEEIKVTEVERQSIVSLPFHLSHSAAIAPKDQFELSHFVDLFVGPGFFSKEGETRVDSQVSTVPYRSEQSNLGLLAGGSYSFQVREGRLELNFKASAETFVRPDCMCGDDTTYNPWDTQTSPEEVVQLSKAELNCQLVYNLNNYLGIYATGEYQVDNQKSSTAVFDLNRERSSFKLGIGATIHPAGNGGGRRN